MYPETKEGLVLCPSCQALNPNENRFCGKCGTPLSARGINDASQKPQKPADMPTELIEFDKKIPLIAQPGSDRRNHVPDNIREKAHEVIERDRAREAETQVFKMPDSREAPTQVFKVTDPRETKTVQMPASLFGVDMTKDAASKPPVAPVKETPKVPAKSTGNGFLNLDYDPKPKTGGSVSGPSFLGLNEEYDEPEEEKSHTRRNLALVVLLALIVLGATQWRAIRDTALPFVKNGTQYVKLKIKGQQEPPPQTAANENATPNGANGPNMEVAPTNQDLNAANQQAQQAQAANGTSTTPATPAGNTSPESTTPTPNGATPNANSAQPTGANATAQPSATDTTRSAANEDSTTPPQEEEATPEKHAKAAAKKPASKPTASQRPQIATQEPVAGAKELAQADAVSDPAQKADWLWKAVKMGSPEASVRLAELYIYGKGVPKNCNQAIVLLRSASAHNYARAAGKLGAMYATGECVQQDRVQAYQWMSAALDANPSSQWTAQYRDSLWKQMTPEERIRAKR